MISSILRFILGFIAIGLVVFIHELGHFFAARFFKVDVECLSYGMGPKLVSFYGKSTEFRISLFPFGGYCRMKGSIDLEKALSDRDEKIKLKEEGSYFAVTPLRRIAIYASGPLTNFILSFILLLIAAVIPVERISNKAYIAPVSSYPDLFDADIRQDNIMPGDLVLSADGKEISDYQELSELLSNSGKAVDVVLLRNGEKVETSLFPVSYDGKMSYGITLYQEPVVGSSSDPMLMKGDRIISVNGVNVNSTLDVYDAESGDTYLLKMLRDGKEFEYMVMGNEFPFSWDSGIVKRSDAGITGSFEYAARETLDFFFSTLEALGALITGNVEDARTVITGPVNAAGSIGNISTEAFSVSSSSGTRTLCYLLAIVSISLCIGNILPIPTFDGGQILICIAEIVRKGSLKAKTYVILQLIGMAAALIIMASMYMLDIRDYFF